MKRGIYYPYQIITDSNLNSMQREFLREIGNFMLTVLGSNTLASGLSCTPSLTGLSVSVGVGAIYSSQQVDSAAYGQLGTDSSIVVKQGILSSPTSLSFTAPTTAGQSISYLVQAAFSEVDSDPVTQQYYNSANPSQAFTGQNNSGLADNTSRTGKVIVSTKAGIPATTGSQTAPVVDSGYVGLYVVTLAYGQTSVTSANISMYANAPFVSETLTQKISKPTAQSLISTAISQLSIPQALSFTPVQQGGGTNQGNNKIYLGWDGYRARIQVDGNDWGQLVNVGDFATSFNGNGYQKLPSGLIFQWGSNTVNGSTATTITFPLVFPHFCLAVIGCNGGAFSAQAGAVSSTYGWTTSSFIAQGSTGTSWVAFGY